MDRLRRTWNLPLGLINKYNISSNSNNINILHKSCWQWDEIKGYNLGLSNDVAILLILAELVSNIANINEVFCIK